MTDTSLVPAPSASFSPSLPSPASPPTVADIVQMCLGFSPKRAAEAGDSRLCVTPLIRQICVDGKVVDLVLMEGKWAAHYARVSDIKQRSQSSDLDKGGEDGSRHKGDGNSELDQIERGIRYYISQGQAFRIYSDAAISGDFPTNSHALIRRMLHKKAQRYKKNFSAILLDPVSYARYTPAERASLHAYLARHMAQIQRGLEGDAEGESKEPTADRSAEAGDERRKRGRPSRRAYHRQGFSQLWIDGQGDHLHTITTGKESRLCRDADLYILFLEMLREHEIELKGLTHAVANLDVTDPLDRGVTYLMASFHEGRLREISHHTFRGKVQALRSGKPQGVLPWYTVKGAGGKAVLVAEYVKIAQRIIHLSLSGLGTANIHTKLVEEGHLVRGKSLTRDQIDTLLTGEGILGIQTHFGLRWPTLPAIVDEETYEALHTGRQGRRKQMADTSAIHNERRWANHLLTHIAYCWCGRQLRRRYVYAYYQGKRTGTKFEYYDCPVTQRQEPHVCIRANVLEGFFEEIVRHNPQVLSGAFHTLEEGTSAQRQAQHALLEARLHTAEAQLAQREQEVRSEARERADKTGLASDSPYYGGVLSGVLDSLLETPRGELALVRQELHTLSEETALERRQACLADHRQRALESLADLQDWDTLDVRTRNNLLKTVFDRAVIYTMERGGTMDLYLTGLDTPLPPVPLQRNSQRALLLPSVAEWIGSIFAV